MQQYAIYVQQSHMTYATVCYLNLSSLAISVYGPLLCINNMDEVSVWSLSLVAQWHELIAVCILLPCV